jgi:hypothetical protein
MIAEMEAERMIEELLEALNENQGLISLIGLFLVIPFAILYESISKYLNRNKDREELERLLLRELWVNINFVAQIEESYKKNLTDADLHIPHYPPRTEILDNLIQLNLIDSLEKRNKDCLLEIYSQLENLKREYYLWREKILSPILIENREIYRILSSTMISYIDPAMRNMLELWIGIVSRKGATSPIPQIQKLNDIIVKEIRSGKWIATSYRASRLINNKPIDMRDFDVIMCWENDMKGVKTQKEIIEIKGLILLHESWR